MLTTVAEVFEKVAIAAYAESLVRKRTFLWKLPLMLIRPSSSTKEETLHHEEAGNQSETFPKPAGVATVGFCVHASLPE